MSFVFSSKKKKGAEVESERKKTSSHLAVQAVLRVHPQLRLALPPELRDLPRIGKGRRRLPQPSVDEFVDPRGAVSGLGTAKDRRADGRRGFRVFEFEMRRLVVVVVDPRAGEGFGQREGDPVVRRRVALFTLDFLELFPLLSFFFFRGEGLQPAFPPLFELYKRKEENGMCYSKSNCQKPALSRK